MGNYLKMVERIRMLSRRRGMTIYSLENQLGFSTSTIGKWGKDSKPPLEKVIQIADFFEVSVDYLLCRTDIPNIDFFEDQEIITLQRARNKMSQKDREKMMKLVRIGFDYAFENYDGNNSDD